MRLFPLLALASLSCSNKAESGLPPGDTAPAATPTPGSGSETGRPPEGDCGRAPPAWLGEDGTADLDHPVALRLYTDGTLRIVHGDPPPPSWVDQEPASVAWQRGGEGEDGWLCAEGWRVSIRPSGQLTIEGPDGRVQLEDGPDGGARRTADGWEVVRQISTGTRLYGLGNRTGAADRRGRTFRLWNTDAYDSAFGGFGPAADPLYLSVPYLLLLDPDGTSRGWFFDVPRDGTVDLTVEGQVRWSVAGSSLVQHLFPGPRPAEVLDAWTARVGRPARPPTWALGYHQCRWGYTPQARLIEVADNFAAYDLPLDALWLDIQHLDRFRTFTFDPLAFPDPEGLMADLHARDLKVVAIVDPGLAVAPGWDVYDRALLGDHLLRKPDGQVFVGRAWPGDSAFPDFTRPATADWWQAEVASLLRRGVDGVWLDVNEPTTFPEGGGGTTVDGDCLVDGQGRGTTQAEVHALYGQLEAQATRRALEEVYPGQRPFVLSRAGYAGLGALAGTWTGDVPSTWTGLRDSLPQMLSLGLSGVPLNGTDVGGYSGGPSPELYARWMALGAISPFFRGHVTQGAPDQEPWAFGQEVLDVSRELLSFRSQLRPHLNTLFAEAAETGAPVLRPLFWRWPDYAAVEDAALLGDGLLVAPVLTEGATERAIDLPPGRWFEWESQAAWDGPTRVTVRAPLAALPRFVEEGSIIPLNEPSRRGVGPTDMTLRAWPARGATTAGRLEDDVEGLPSTTWRFLLTGRPDGATLVGEPTGETFPDRRWTVELAALDHPPRAVRLNGLALGTTEDLETVAQGWVFDPDDRTLSVRIPAPRAPFTLEADYDPTLLELRPPVRLPLTVSGPPAAGVIHVASDANGWVHQPLRADEAGFVGELSVPRGDWFEYKYSRGDWDTAEMYPGCEEAKNRYLFGSARRARTDEVYGWRDACP